MHPESSPTGRYGLLVKQLAEEVPRPLEWRKCCLELCLAQEKSLLLTQNSDPEEVEAATRAKGGWAAMVCRQVLDNDLVHGEQEVLFEMGYLAQLMDDIFDLVADRKAGRITSATWKKNVDEAGGSFSEKERAWVRQVDDLGYGKKQCRDFGRFIHLSLSATYVCLDYYKRFERRHNINPFSEEIHSVPKLVCDMETVHNRCNLLIQAWRWGKGQA